MKFHYAGKYNGDENSLPRREHPTGYVQFKEADMKKFALIMNVLAFIIIFALIFIINVISEKNFKSSESFLGIIFSLVTLIPTPLS